jgi:hypothetical protein
MRQIPKDGWQKHRITHKKAENRFLEIKCFCERYKAIINVERIKAKLP